MEDGDCNTLGTLELQSLPLSPFLLFPPEVLLIIYQMLFTNLRVKMHNQATRLTNTRALSCEHAGCAMLSLSQNSTGPSSSHCNMKYYSVLRKRLGPHKMACIHQIAVGGFYMNLGKTTALDLTPITREALLRVEKPG
jgi:hypothetical protein